MKTKIISILALLLTVTQGAWAQVGRVLATDGKYYKTVTAATNAGTTASGVIAYVPASGDMLVMSLTVATNGGNNAMAWGSGTAATGSWIRAYATLSDALGAAGGVAATDEYVKYHNGDNGGQWTAAIAARNYSTARPSGASAWSLPSAGDWNNMLKALAGTSSNISTSSQAIFSTTSVSSKLTAAGASGLGYANFWSSTEGTAGNVWTLVLTTDGGSMYHGEKSQDSYTFLRPIFTFPKASATAAEYTVSYNANGGDGAPSAQTKDGGIDLTLSSTVPTRTGYTFLGWATSADGAVDYAAGATYSANADVTLYAQWTVASVNCLPSDIGKVLGTDGKVYATVDAAGGISNVSGMIAYVNGTTGIAIGPSDLLWNSSDGSQKMPVSTAISACNGYGKTRPSAATTGWRLPSQADFNNMIGSNGCESADNLRNMIGRQASSCGCYAMQTDEGYWSSTQSGSGVYYNLWSTNCNAVAPEANEKYVRPCFTFNVTPNYTISFNANGGSGSVASQTKFEDTDITLPSSGFTRDGYTFAGWATSADGAVAYAAGATYTGNADLSLYAKWTANTYSVQFNGNGSTSGSMDNESFTYDEAKTLTTNAFSRTGYTFDGWATTADGAVEYADGQSVSNLTAENGATVELFAHWSSNTTTSGIDWNPATNSGTFLMPAYNVEVSTELWYILKQDGTTPAGNETKTNVFLDRTLQSLPGDNKGWNTFCAPFDISAEKVTALGMTVKAFTGSTLSGGTLTLHFETASSIAAGTPYLVQVASNLNFAADGNEFAGVTQDWTAHNATSTYADFVPVLEPTELTANDPNVLFVYGGNELGHPSVTGNILGFRAYFQLEDAAASVKAFAMSFDDEVATGISSLTPNPSPVGEGSIYTLDGRKVNGQPTRKGVYIVNGKKTIIK